MNNLFDTEPFDTDLEFDDEEFYEMLESFDEYEGEELDENFEFDEELFQAELPDEELHKKVNLGARDYIRWVQQSLNKILGFRLAVDGKMGPATEKAIRSFQQRQGLRIDGIVGPSTEAALINAGATRPPAPSVAASQKPGTYKAPPGIQCVPSKKCPVIKCISLDRFALGDYRMRPHHYEPLLVFLHSLKKISIPADGELGIVGYTDERGSDNMNNGLGFKRALEVKIFIEAVLAHKDYKLLKPLPIFIGSLGKKNPISSNPDRNRRVEVVLCRRVNLV